MVQPNAEDAARTTVVVSRGLEALVAATGPLARLHSQAQTPITARGVWTECWSIAHPEYEPLIVTVRTDPESTEFLAAAVLASRRLGPVDLVVVAGHGFSDHVRLPAVDPEAERELARGIAEVLTGRARPWRLVIEQVSPHDPVVAHLQTLLPQVEVAPDEGHGSPWIRLDQTSTTPAGPSSPYLSKKHRKQLRRLERRLAERGAVRFERHTEPDDIRSLLPELGRLRRLRDTEQGRRSILDSANGRVFWPLLIHRLAEIGAIEVITLRNAGTLVAYVIALRDGSAYRLWGGRMHPDWAEFRVGALVDVHALGVACEEGFEEFDMMRGESAHKMRMATAVRPSTKLRAWSSPAVARTDHHLASLMNRLRGVRDESEVLGRLWHRITLARWSG